MSVNIAGAIQHVKLKLELGSSLNSKIQNHTRGYGNGTTPKWRRHLLRNFTSLLPFDLSQNRHSAVTGKLRLRLIGVLQ